MWYNAQPCSMILYPGIVPGAKIWDLVRKKFQCTDFVCQYLLLLPFQRHSASITENWTKVVSGLCHKTWIGVVFFSVLAMAHVFLWSVLLISASFCCLTVTLLWWTMGKQQVCLGIPEVFCVFLCTNQSPSPESGELKAFSMFSNTKFLKLPFNHEEASGDTKDKKSCYFYAANFFLVNRSPRFITSDSWHHWSKFRSDIFDPLNEKEEKHGHGCDSCLFLTW